MKNRTAKTTTLEPIPQVNNKKAMIGSPRRHEEPLMEKIAVPAKIDSISRSKEIAMEQLVRLKNEGLAEAAQDRYNRTPFRNNAIDLFDRKRYDISREFDGKEVEGTLMERPTVGGGRLEVERFNMPQGGIRVERTRFNAEGMPVNRTIRDRGIN